MSVDKLAAEVPSAPATVDVLVPHYNDPEGLSVSLQSAIDQEGPFRLRIVVADDGSTPEHLAAVEGQLEALPCETVLLKNGTNRGRPFTRNVLLDAIESDYVTWLDAADIWYPRKLELQMERLTAVEPQKRNRTWVTCNYDMAWIGEETKLSIQKVHKPDQVKALLAGGELRAYLWTLLGTAEAFKSVGPFDLNLGRLQDLDFFIRFAETGGEIVAPDFDEPLCRYIKTDKGRSGDEVRRCHHYIYKKHHKLYRRYGKAFRRRMLCKMDLLAARFSRNNGLVLRERFYRTRAWWYDKDKFRAEADR